VYRGFSPPAPGERGRREESSVNYEGGARWSSKVARFEAIGFYNDYSNITNVCTFSTGCDEAQLDRQADGGAARIYGAEVFGETSVPLGRALRLPLRVAYTFTESEFLTSFSSSDPIFGTVQAGDAIPYVPPHQLSATAGLEAERWALDASLLYVAAMRERAGRGDGPDALLTDESVVLDVSGSVRLLSWLRAYVNVRNVLDGQFVASRRPFGARPNAPRWLQAGLRAEF
jgi:Fe(3+) dicitrate transport protein